LLGELALELALFEGLALELVLRAQHLNSLSRKRSWRSLIKEPRCVVPLDTVALGTTHKGRHRRFWCLLIVSGDICLRRSLQREHIRAA